MKSGQLTSQYRHTRAVLSEPPAARGRRSRPAPAGGALPGRTAPAPRTAAAPFPHHRAPFPHPSSHGEIRDGPIHSPQGSWRRAGVHRLPADSCSWAEHRYSSHGLFHPGLRRMNCAALRFLTLHTPTHEKGSVLIPITVSKGNKSSLNCRLILPFFPRQSTKLFGTASRGTRSSAVHSSA